MFLHLASFKTEACDISEMAYCSDLYQSEDE